MNEIKIKANRSTTLADVTVLAVAASRSTTNNRSTVARIIRNTIMFSPVLSMRFSENDERTEELVWKTHRQTHARNTQHTYTRYIPMSPAYNVFSFICLFIRMVYTARLISFPIDEPSSFVSKNFRTKKRMAGKDSLDSDDREKRAVTNRSECRRSTGTCHLPDRWSNLRNGLIFVALRHFGILPLYVPLPTLRGPDPCIE